MERLEYSGGPVMCRLPDGCALSMSISSESMEARHSSVLFGPAVRAKPVPTGTCCCVEFWKLTHDLSTEDAPVCSVTASRVPLYAARNPAVQGGGRGERCVRRRTRTCRAVHGCRWTFAGVFNSRVGLCLAAPQGLPGYRAGIKENQGPACWSADVASSRKRSGAVTMSREERATLAIPMSALPMPAPWMACGINRGLL